VCCNDVCAWSFPSEVRILIPISTLVIEVLLCNCTKRLANALYSSNACVCLLRALVCVGRDQWIKLNEQLVHYGQRTESRSIFYYVLLCIIYMFAYFLFTYTIRKSPLLIIWTLGAHSRNYDYTLYLHHLQLYMDLFRYALVT